MDNKRKGLIIYFSRADENYNVGNLTIGNTEQIVNMIKEKIPEIDVFKVERKKDYPKEYTPCTVEAKDELKMKARPELKESLSDIKKYDIILIGYPIWWGTFPCPLFTQLEKLDFKNKIVLPFCTHEGSGISGSMSDIKKCCSGAIIKEGLSIQGSTVKNSKATVFKWIDNNFK